MSDVTVRFACQHPARVLGSAADLSSVVCEVCGERRVQAVAAPPPRFRAVDCDVKGPLVVTHG